jgi:hypothetical protein
MPDVSHSPEAGDDARHDPDEGAPSGTSRWVVLVGVVIVAALLGLIVFLHLTGAIGPGAH